MAEWEGFEAYKSKAIPMQNQIAVFILCSISLEPWLYDTVIIPGDLCLGAAAVLVKKERLC